MDFIKKFEKCLTVEEARNLYRKLAKENHPDLGGNTETMKIINSAYELYTSKNCNSEEFKSESIVMKKIIEVLLMNLPDDCLIELVGSWIWVSGNTKEHKERLKASKMKWSNTRKKWYWHDGKIRKSRANSGTFEEIKFRHGSRLFSPSRRAVFA